jgi:hypothetical protein
MRTQVITTQMSGVQSRNEQILPMSKPFRTSGGSALIRSPVALKTEIMVLIRQIDEDRDPQKAVHWLIEMMEVRGEAPKWKEKKED